MIGNDVIDLCLAQRESNWQRHRYLDKIYTPNEQNLILSSENPIIMVWTLWSRKEAVYKIIRQENGERGFYPLKIINSDFKKGIVYFENKKYYAHSTISGEMLHTVALKKRLFNQVVELNSEVEIYKKNEIPYLNYNGVNHFISKSHHGRFEKVVSIIE